MTDSTDNARLPELLPCPFCGEAGEYESRHRVSCSNEGCWAFYKTRSVTASEWNTRADLAPDPLADPRIKALMAAAGAYVEAADPVAGTEQINEEEWDEYCDAREAYRAALAAFEGGKTDD